jgi:hypothetical protein
MAGKNKTNDKKTKVGKKSFNGYQVSSSLTGSDAQIDQSLASALSPILARGSLVV